MENTRFYFGGQGGSDYFGVKFTHQEVEFIYGSVLNAIKVGEHRYGTSGGGNTTTVTFGSSDSITLYRIEASDYNGNNIISYLHFRYGDDEYKIGLENQGGESSTCILNFEPTGCQVSVNGIHCGTEIDGMLFILKQ